MSETAVECLRAEIQAAMGGHYAVDNAGQSSPYFTLNSERYGEIDIYTREKCDLLNHETDTADSIREKPPTVRREALFFFINAIQFRAG